MGWLAIAAGILFGLSLVLLTAFFRTQDTRMDLLATWGLVAFSVLVIPVMLLVRDEIAGIGVAATALTAAGIIGVGVLGLAELATALKLIDFRRVATATTLGFVLFLLWVGGVSLVLVVAPVAGLSVNLGWLGLASIVVGIAILIWIIRVPGVLTGDTEPSTAAMTVFFLPLAGIVAWLGWLGLQL